ncbi:MAG: hypothetical protein LAN36_01805 [Acidobacteriia bacterium]|nr:hypothetical protein [Terriglobia bacterium]
MSWQILVLAGAIVFAGLIISKSLRGIAESTSQLSGALDQLRGKPGWIRVEEDGDKIKEEFGTGIEGIMWNVLQIRYALDRIEEHLRPARTEPSDPKYP